MKSWQTLTRRLRKYVRKELRVVLDTNVLISASIIHHGFPARILEAAVVGEIKLVVSVFALSEYLNVTKRPHIASKYRTLSEDIAAVVDLLSRGAIRVAGMPSEPIIQQDPKDDFLLASAVEGKAKYIVSGDEHLLRLGVYHGIRILTPRDFVLNVLKESIPESR
jgi:uncharacterized protein